MVQNYSRGVAFKNQMEELAVFTDGWFDFTCRFYFTKLFLLL